MNVYLRLLLVVLWSMTAARMYSQVHRLNYLLSMGKCVISETSSDSQLDEQVYYFVFSVTVEKDSSYMHVSLSRVQYAGVVLFRKMEHMLATAVEILEDTARRRQMELKAVSFVLDLLNTSRIEHAMKDLA